MAGVFINWLAAKVVAGKYCFSMTQNAFELYHPARSGRTRLLFVCDHASNALPAEVGTLGLPLPALQTHIAWDIGASHVTRALAEHFSARAVLARWSRLLIDLNRGADDPTLVMRLSDGNIVPGNKDAGDTEIARRIALYHAPYHAAIAAEIDNIRMSGNVPVLISIHSFTPSWKGITRPWELGILWDRDGRLARPLIGAFREAGFAVGDNEPYSGELENDCLYRHGTMNGLPHVLIEIRQDLIADEKMAAALAARLEPVLEGVLAKLDNEGLYFTRPLGSMEIAMDENTRRDLESAVFRRLVAHLRERPDVQNIDLMNVGGFCRNCLGDWYRDAAAERGIALEKDEARGIVYGMAPSEWKKRYQKEASAEQQAAFEKSQKTHK
jgi:predicted N-formylglutamate amidohydrolase